VLLNYKLLIFFFFHPKLGKWNSNLLEFNTTLLTKQNIITEEEGTFSLHIETENTSHDKIKFAKCSLRFFNGDGHSRQIKHANVHLVGLHFQQLGILLLQSENSKFFFFFPSFSLLYFLLFYFI